MANRLKFTPKMKDAFIEALLANGGFLRLAAKTIGITYQTVHNHRDKSKTCYDQDFCDRIEAALNITTERMEEEAARRAFSGVDEPVYYKGELVDTKKAYSDTLAMFMLKGRKPDTYRDNARIEHTGKGGGPIETSQTVNVGEMTLQELRNLRSTLKRDESGNGNGGGNGHND